MIQLETIPIFYEAEVNIAFNVFRAILDLTSNKLLARLSEIILSYSVHREWMTKI